MKPPDCSVVVAGDRVLKIELPREGSGIATNV